MGWFGRYGSVVMGCTAGSFGFKLVDGEQVTGRTVVMWQARRDSNQVEGENRDRTLNSAPETSRGSR